MNRKFHINAKVDIYWGNYFQKLKLRQMSTVSNIQVLPKIKYNTINVSLNKHTSRFLTFSIKYLSIIY